MRKVTTLIWKDLILQFSGPTSLLFFLILPVVFTFLVGGGFSSIGDGDTADVSVQLPVANDDDGELSRQLLSELEKSGALQIELVDGSAGKAAFDDGDMSAFLAIPQGFTASAETAVPAPLTLFTQPDDSDARIVTGNVNAALSRLNQPLRAAQASVETAAAIVPFSDARAARTYFETSLDQARMLAAEVNTTVNVTRPESDKKQSAYDPAAQSSIGQLITWVFIPLLGTSGFLAMERNRGTLRRLLTTPTKKATYLLGTISGALFTGLVQMLLLILFGVLVMGVTWGRSPAGLVVILVTFGLAAVALGTMLGTFVRTESQASNVSIMFGMTMALLGGCWWPHELFPPALKTAVRVLPTTWAMQGMSDLVIGGQGLAGVLPEAGVLLGFAALFFIVGIGRFRYE